MLSTSHAFCNSPHNRPVSHMPLVNCYLLALLDVRSSTSPKWEAKFAPTFKHSCPVGCQHLTNRMHDLLWKSLEWECSHIVASIIKHEEDGWVSPWCPSLLCVPRGSAGFRATGAISSHGRGQTFCLFLLSPDLTGRIKPEPFCPSYQEACHPSRWAPWGVCQGSMWSVACGLDTWHQASSWAKGRAVTPSGPEALLASTPHLLPRQCYFCLLVVGFLRPPLCSLRGGYRRASPLKGAVGPNTGKALAVPFMAERS